MPQFRIIATILFALIATPLNAETNGVLRIGVLNDMSSVYSDFQGPGSVVAAQMAIEDFNKRSKRKVEVTSGDHQNKPDIGAGIARRWLDVEGVDMIIDLPNSAVALAVGDIVREKNKVAIGSGAGTALLTGAKCSPNFVHWTYDTWAMGHGIGARRARLRRQDLVLRHRRLRVRARSRETGERRGRRKRWQDDRNRTPPDWRVGFLVFPAAGAGLGRGSRCAGECRRRHDKYASNRPPNSRSASKQKIVSLIFDLQSVPALGLNTAQGLIGDQCVLLGHERSDPRLVEALPGAPCEEDDAQPHAGRRLCRACCITSRQSRKSARRRTAQRSSRR